MSSNISKGLQFMEEPQEVVVDRYVGDKSPKGHQPIEQIEKVLRL